MPKLAQLLLDAGADVRALDRDGLPPLAYASSVPMAQLLLAALDARPQPGDAQLLRQSVAHMASRGVPDVFAFVAKQVARRDSPAAVADVLASPQVGQDRRSLVAAALVRSCVADSAAYAAQWPAVRAAQAALPGERAAVRELLLGVAPVASAALHV